MAASFSADGLYHTEGKSLESESVLGIGDAGFEPVDIKWLKVMALYAATHGMESMTAFQSECFFLYVDGQPDSGPEYKRKVEQAILRKKHTKTYVALRQLTREFGHA